MRHKLMKREIELEGGIKTKRSKERYKKLRKRKRDWARNDPISVLG